MDRRQRVHAVLDEGSIEVSTVSRSQDGGPASDSDEAGPLSGTQLPSTPTAPASSLLSGTLNLLNTIVGGGILSLPFAFKSCGLLTGVLYQCVFGAMSWYGCYLLLDSVQHAKTATSFEGLAQVAFGRAGFLAYNVAALVNCYGACVSYVIVVGDVLAPLCEELGLPLRRPLLLCLVVGGLIFPLSTLRDISSLRHASGLAVAIYSLFVLCLLALPLLAPHSATDGGGDGSADGGDGRADGSADGGCGGGGGAAGPALLPPGHDLGGLIRAVPLCAFAFMCQTSLFPIYQVRP